MIEKDKILAEIVERVTKVIPVQRIYLFGSRARGDNHTGSDYDILIVVDDIHNENLNEFTLACYRAKRGLGVAIDFVIVTNSYFSSSQKVINTIPEAAVSEGRELYAN